MSILASPMYFIMVVSAVLTLILSLVNKVFTDPDRMKEIQATMKSYNKELMAATRAKDNEKLEKLQKDKPKISQMQQEMMKMQKPIFLSMIPFLVVFYFLGKLATGQGWGEFIQLPFTISLFSVGNDLTWIGWYMWCSLPFTMLFRKALGIS
ncbi:TPA: DUF106 domain-containing protein [archaeon]|nr:DUF106 domain-containing protein [Candidatus Undinarchaeales archaeon SRR5007147.bin71]